MGTIDFFSQGIAWLFVKQNLGSMMCIAYGLADANSKARMRSPETR